MSDVDAAIVFLPRFTTLVGASEFSTLALDVSRFGSAQFHLWRGPMRGASPTFVAYLEESLDAEHWVLGPSTPTGYDPATDDPTLTRPKLFSYGFRLRWFRIRIVLGGTLPAVTCWAEGLLRDGGGGGAWAGSPSAASQFRPAAAYAPSAWAGSGPTIGAVAPAPMDAGRSKATPSYAAGPSFAELLPPAH